MKPVFLFGMISEEDRQGARSVDTTSTALQTVLLLQYSINILLIAIIQQYNKQ